ncbi:MAG: hypothetical protein WCO56_29535, partial [Verrucomicrobiota bacterium]
RRDLHPLACQRSKAAPESGEEEAANAGAPGPSQALVDAGIEHYASAVADDLRDFGSRVAALLEITDDAVLQVKAMDLVRELETIKADILKLPKSAQALAEVQVAALFTGLTERGKSFVNSDQSSVRNKSAEVGNGGNGSGNYDHAGRKGQVGGSQAGGNPGAGKSKPVGSLKELIEHSEGPTKAHYEFDSHPESAARIDAATGVKVAGFKHRVEADKLRHFKNSHGDGKDQHELGAQEPLTKADYERIPEVVHRFDSVTKSPKESRDGKVVLRYKKRFNGTLMYYEEVRDKTGTLAGHSLRKFKAGLPDAKAPGQTSEAPSSK